MTFEEIVSIEVLDKQQVYDLMIENTHNFIANDIVAHNTYLATSSGNVGIGTTSPNYLLQVASGTDGRSVNLSNVLYVNGSSGNVGIGTTSPTELLVVAGNANITGTLYKGTSAYTNPDIAEMISSTQSLEEGDIVIVDPNSFNKVISSNAKFQTAIGVVSPNATMVIGDWKGGFSGEKIAMFGRVMVKVTDENSMIKAGDLITTSSKEGYAMKCKNREECHYEVLGVAMQEQTKPKDKILMVIKR